MASKALFEVDETMEETLKNVSDIDEQTAKILYENGKYLLMGGEKGNISMMDWKEKNLILEFNV